MVNRLIWALPAWCHELIDRLTGLRLVDVRDFDTNEHLYFTWAGKIKA